MVCKLINFYTFLGNWYLNEVLQELGIEWELLSTPKYSNPSLCIAVSHHIPSTLCVVLRKDCRSSMAGFETPVSMPHTNTNDDRDAEF
jgi:hypothetical protein